MNLIYRIALFSFCYIYSLSASGQTAKVNSLIDDINAMRSQLPVEKLYLQLNQPYYMQKDTIWFKAYPKDKPENGARHLAKHNKLRKALSK
jgi:hypothetical protein